MKWIEHVIFFFGVRMGVGEGFFKVVFNRDQFHKTILWPRSKFVLRSMLAVSKKLISLMKTIRLFKIKLNIAAAHHIQIVLRLNLSLQRHVVCLQIGISFGWNVPSGANTIYWTIRRIWTSLTSFVSFNTYDQMGISLERPTKICHTLPT